MLWLWGLLGAFVYAAPTLALALWTAEPPKAGDQKARHILAIAQFLIAELTGAIFAAGLTDTVRAMLTRFVVVEAVPVALTIGWACNYLWPIMLKRLGVRAGQAIEKLGGAPE